MSSLFKAFETSKDLISKGAPLKLPKNADGTIPVMHIARAHSSNQLYAKAVADVYTPEINERLSDLDEDEARGLEIEVVLASNLIGWENIHGRDDKPLEFNAENARQLFTELPELFDIVRRFSYQMSNYLKSAEDKAVKNW